MDSQSPQSWTIGIRKNNGKHLKISYICISIAHIYFFNIEGVNNTNGLSNAITTTKYTWYSWLPKSLWEQFRRVANIYFLLISILMVWSYLYNFNFLVIISYSIFVTVHRHVCNSAIRFPAQSFQYGCYFSDCSHGHLFKRRIRRLPKST